MGCWYPINECPITWLSPGIGWYAAIACCALLTAWISGYQDTHTIACHNTATFHTGHIIDDYTLHVCPSGSFCFDNAGSLPGDQWVSVDTNNKTGHRKIFAFGFS